MTEEEFFAVEGNGKHCMVRTFYHDKYKQIVVEYSVQYTRITIRYSAGDSINTLYTTAPKKLSKITYDEVVKIIDDYYKRKRKFEEIQGRKILP